MGRYIRPILFMAFLLIDNYDSFTYILAHELEKAGLSPITIYRNDDDRLLLLQPNDWHGVILSPGPGTPNDAGLLMQTYRSIKYRIPVFGVCLGFQAMCIDEGFKLTRGQQPWHGIATPIHHHGQGLFADVQQPMPVGRYHSLVIEPDPATDWSFSAFDALGNPMAFEHHEKKLYGVQFHPESCLTPQGSQLLKNLVHLWLNKK